MLRYDGNFKSTNKATKSYRHELTEILQVKTKKISREFFSVS